MTPTEPQRLSAERLAEIRAWIRYGYTKPDEWARELDGHIAAIEAERATEYAEYQSELEAALQDLANRHTELAQARAVVEMALGAHRLAPTALRKQHGNWWLVCECGEHIDAEDIDAGYRMWQAHVRHEAARVPVS